MSTFCLDKLMGNDCCGLFEETPKRRNSFIELASVFDPNKLTNDNNPQILSAKESKPSSIKYLKSSESSPNLSELSIRSSPKTNSVQLYKPIYIARHSQNISNEFSYDEDDEFELINKVDDDHLCVIHLRTNTECILHRKYLHRDPNTPLRLGSDDRGVIQRCLFQYNVPGAYLIRRSKNQINAFVLSVAQISNQKNAEDWHYLIRVDPITHRFYFAQEKKLDKLSFTTFQKLIEDDKVLSYIPLTEILPFRIDFEEDLWHIPRRHLTFENRIGKGEFGEVWRALWQNGNRTIPVAVKKLHPLRRDKSTMNSFIREIETMKTLRNNYIVALYGVAEDLQTNETLLITELMENGDLKNWLKSLPNILDEQIIISFAYDICRGMFFLEQRSLVHRDLACRNLLLSGNGNTVKIADFGLSTIVNKDDFIQRKESYLHKLPIRWTAPEILYDRTVYSIKSDVWSFGIVLIEIWLKGNDPYPEEKEFSSIRTLVQNGYVHKKPSHCSNQFYNQLILPCLCFEPNQRPSFKSLVEFLRHWNREKAEYDRLNNLSIEYLS